MVLKYYEVKTNEKSTSNHNSYLKEEEKKGNMTNNKKELCLRSGH